MNKHILCNVILGLSFASCLEAVRSRQHATHSCELPEIIPSDTVELKGVVKKKKQKKCFYEENAKSRNLTHYELNTCNQFLDIMETVSRKSKKDIEYSKKAKRYVKKCMVTYKKEGRLETLLSYAESASEKYLSDI